MVPNGNASSAIRVRIPPITQFIHHVEGDFIVILLVIPILRRVALPSRVDCHCAKESGSES